MTDYFNSRRQALTQEKDSLLAAGENNNKMLQTISEQNQQINLRSAVIDALLVELDTAEKSYRDGLPTMDVDPSGNLAAINNLVRPANVLE